MQIMENWAGKKIKSYSVEGGKEGKKMDEKHHYLCFFCYVNVFLSLCYL